MTNDKFAVETDLRRSSKHFVIRHSDFLRHWVIRHLPNQRVFRHSSLSRYNSAGLTQEGTEMLAGLRRDFRLAPLTFSLLAGTVLLFFAAEFSRGRGDDPMNSGRRAFGSVETLALTADQAIHGPFDLWAGPWWRGWRIPASAFHHANLLHLFCNISMLWFLGPLLERRLRWWSYLAFWLMAAIIPFLFEYLMGQTAVGLSGVACAMFGWCLIERAYDPFVATRANDGFVKSTWMFLIGCIPATIVGLLPVANVAHFSGVAYGWLFARAGRWRSWRWSVLLGQAVLVPLGVWFVLHPFWNARYHAYVGLRADSDLKDHATAEQHFRAAIQLNPGLALPWHGLALNRLHNKEPLEAWRLTVDGLKANRSSSNLAELAQHVWRHLPRQDRAAGRQHLETAFADEAAVWSQRLKLDEQPTSESDLSDLLRELFPTTPARRERPNIDPDKKDSAAEGELL